MKYLKPFFLSLLVIVLSTGCNIDASENKTKSPVETLVTHLKCEYRSNPMGIDKPKPKLSWMLESNKRGNKQIAYRVLVASSLEKLDKNLGDLWDSEIIKSEQSLNVVYNGSVLKSRTQYFWKVRIKDASGTMSAWSIPAFFIMGMLSQEEWQANWVQSDLELFDYQKEFPRRFKTLPPKTVERCHRFSFI